MTVTLNQLIDQVRHELLSPRRAETPAEMYPFLFIEEIELEVGITISGTMEGSGGVNIQVIEVGGSASRANEEAHRVTIKMKPLLDRDEVRTKLKQDTRTWEKIEHVVVPAVTKEGGMVGQE